MGVVLLAGAGLKMAAIAIARVVRIQERREQLNRSRRGMQITGIPLFWCGLLLLEAAAVKRNTQRQGT
jgi:hypothetical protein